MEKENANKGTRVIINYQPSPYHLTTGKILSTNGPLAKVLIDPIWFTKKVRKRTATVEILVHFLDYEADNQILRLKSTFPNKDDVKSTEFLDYFFSPKNFCMIEACMNYAFDRGLVNTYDNKVKEFDLCKKHFSRLHGTHQINVPVKAHYIAHHRVPRVSEEQKA